MPSLDLKFYAICGLALALLATVAAWRFQAAALHAEVAEARQQLAETRTALEAERGNVQALRGQIDAQNEAVARLKADAARIDAEAAARVERALVAAGARRNAIEADKARGAGEMNAWFARTFR